MHAKYGGDPQQGGDAGVGSAGFDGLVGGATYAGCEEDGLLRAVVAHPADADAVADGASLTEEPLVVIGQRWHSTNAVPKMIISQPGLPGIF